MADSKLDKILLDDGYGNSPIQWSWNEKLILEKWNMGSEEVWKTDSVDDSIQRSIQRAVEHRLSKVLENGIVWDRSASTYKNPMTFSVTGSDTTITIATGGEVIINGRLIEVSTGDITTLSSLSISESYYLLITLTTATSTGDDLNFNKVLQSAWDEQDPTDRDKQVRIATFTTDGSGNIDSVQTFSGDLTGLPNKESITYDKIVTVPNHDHSGDLGDGGQLFQIKSDTNSSVQTSGNILSITLTIANSSNDIEIIATVTGNITEGDPEVMEIKLKDGSTTLQMESQDIVSKTSNDGGGAGTTYRNLSIMWHGNLSAGSHTIYLNKVDTSDVPAGGAVLIIKEYRYNS